MATGHDGLYEECVGPSAYWKSQGTSVRVWGLLAAGILFITVLPEGEVMNQYVCSVLIEGYFEDLSGNCEYLVCDYELFYVVLNHCSH